MELRIGLMARVVGCSCGIPGGCERTGAGGGGFAGFLSCVCLGIFFYSRRTREIFYYF